MSDWQKLNEQMDKISALHGVDKICIGKSLLKRDIYAFHKGKYDAKQILITGGIHSREYISSFVVLKLIEEYDNDVGCYFVPVINLDGVSLCCEGLSSVCDKDYHNLLLRLNNNSTDFSKWKANARGVDLNVNFDIGWGQSPYITEIPGECGFCGEAPNSEVEVRKLLNFVSGINIQLSICYHSKGQVVYYGYKDLNSRILAKENKMAKYFARALGYQKVRSRLSTGGFGDYLGGKLNIPSITIELGSDKLSHPISYSHIDMIYKNQYKALKGYLSKHNDY